MDMIFKEIVEENKKIKKAKEKNLKSQISNLKTEVGKMVEQALVKKKEKETKKIADILRRAASEYKLNKTNSDNMFMNAAFLVYKGSEKEFDNTMDDLSKEYKDRIKFLYAGPLPVFNFVNLVIYPEEWEG
jgi:uncharacterized protein YpuA (DUF1002 family)